MGNIWGIKEMELLSPLGRGRGKVILPKKMEVVGFLPTWMVGKTRLYGDEISQLIFLGVEVKPDGSLLWDSQSKKINNDDYLRLKANIIKTGGKNILGIKLFKDKELDQLMASEEAKQILRKEVATLVKEGNFDGVNIDFEYMSSPTRIMDDDFLDFYKSVKSGEWGEIGIDVFANTVIKGPVDRLKLLVDSVDWVVVMAYDFSRQGSKQAGFVAPIGDASGLRNIGEIYQKIADHSLDKSKIIMAYPLYGYEWRTVDGGIRSFQVSGGYGRTVQYHESIGFTGIRFDEVAKSPWAAWTEKETVSSFEYKKIGNKTKKVIVESEIDRWHQAYFEDEKSLRYKVEMAKQAQVGGVGWWALGYEGANSDLVVRLLQ